MPFNIIILNPKILANITRTKPEHYQDLSFALPAINHTEFANQAKIEHQN